MPPKSKNKLVSLVVFKEAGVQQDEEANDSSITANQGKHEANKDKEEEMFNKMILKELLEYRQEMKKEFAKTNTRLEEARKIIVGNKENYKTWRKL